MEEAISSLNTPGTAEWDTANAEYLLAKLQQSGVSGPEVDRLIAKANKAIEAAQDYVAQQHEAEVKRIQAHLDEQHLIEEKKLAAKQVDLQQKQKDEATQKAHVQLHHIRGFSTILDRQLEQHTNVKLQTSDGKESTTLLQGTDDNVAAILSAFAALDRSIFDPSRNGLDDPTLGRNPAQSTLPSVTPMQTMKSTNPVSAFEFDDITNHLHPPRPGSTA